MANYGFAKPVQLVDTRNDLMMTGSIG